MVRLCTHAVLGIEVRRAQRGIVAHPRLNRNYGGSEEAKTGTRKQRPHGESHTRAPHKPFTHFQTLAAIGHICGGLFSSHTMCFIRRERERERMRERENERE
uniref:Uncharacterized protein n=1 Tax=Micrurus paraensis TaxID=1970185 RepID=A0A2D4L3W7_9SAUR